MGHNKRLFSCGSPYIFFPVSFKTVQNLEFSLCYGTWAPLRMEKILKKKLIKDICGKSLVWKTTKALLGYVLRHMPLKHNLEYNAGCNSRKRQTNTQTMW